MRIRTIVASLVALAAVAVATLAGTSGAAAGARADVDRLQVVTTVSPLTNIAANVAGGLADVTGVIPEGANSHEFEPAPSLAKTLSKADVIFVNGLHLEQPTKELAEANLKEGAEIVELGPRTITEKQWLYDFSFPKSGGDPNPHLWTNPPYAKRYAEIFRDVLSRRDPAHARAYARNYTRYAAQLDRLDRAISGATATLPRGQRKLLTYHDSFAYFARTYGWTVIGAIQPADFSDPTPKEVANLIKQIRNAHVKAIFGSEVFSSPVLKQIAKESGARYVTDLRDDDLPGKPGDPDHTIVSLLRFDYSTIVKALGGNPAGLDRLKVANTARDTADYPQ
jgi:ABC-type Zn uptake system ZnuABC Zn-binding protein ZnuA